MKKFAKIFLITLLSILLLVVIYVAATFPPVMAGMAAKTMCSCLFVSGRTPESVVQKELQVFPGLAQLDIDVNWQDSTATANLLWQHSKAIYRRGLGCTLLAEAPEADVRQQTFNIFHPSYPDQDTIPWPTGDMNAWTAPWTADSAAIAAIVAHSFDDTEPEEPVNTHAVVVVHKGKIIAEKYAPGFGPHSVLTGWSMTKSITNALIGILVRDGKLALNDPAPVEEWQGDARRNITLNDLLHASSGLEWQESYFIPTSDFHTMFIKRDDKAAYAASRKLVHTPGEFFEYSSGTTNILSRIIRETVGEQNYHRFPYEALFSQIGMYHALIEPDASGTFVASSYGFASARDWARLGMLYLNDGVWNDKRILPEGWVKYSTTPAPAAKKRQYGAQVWLNLGEEGHPLNCDYPGLPSEAIVFDGFEKNFVVIIPSKQLVVVRLGVTHNANFSLPALVTGIAKLLPDADRDTMAVK